MGWRRVVAQPTVRREVFKGDVPAVIGPVEAGLDDAYWPDDELTRWDLRRQVARVLRTLTPREERVLRLRYGFCGEERTHADIADEFCLTKERIRQIEAKAIRKIKHPARGVALREFVTGCAPPSGKHRLTDWRTKPAPKPRLHLVEVNGDVVAVRIKARFAGDHSHRKATGLPGPYVLFDHGGQEWLASVSELKGTTV